MIKKILLLLSLGLYLHAEGLAIEGRKFGVEFNFPRLLTYSDSWKSASGAFSYFDHQNHIEIAFPWVISHNGNDDDYGGVLKSRSIDIQYRKFLEERLGGFYVSGFARLTHLDGKLSEGPYYQKTLKAGIGMGIGIRLFPKNGRIYWGAGLMVGRYLGNQNDIYYRGHDFDFFAFDDAPIILDIEFLKVGYAF